MCPRSWRRWPPPPPLTPPPLPRDYSVGWPPVNWEQAQAAFSNQMDLEGKIADLLSTVESGQCNQVNLKSVLLSMQDNAGGLRAYFSDQYRHYPKFFNERKSEDSSTACKVFDIPELLEMISEHLSIPDLLNFYQCSRAIRDTIEGSSKLQTQLSLRPAPLNSHLRLPLRNLTKFAGGSKDPDCFFPFSQVGFSSYEHMGRRIPRTMQPYEEVDDRTVEIHACFYLLPGQILPSMGSRIRQMQILQPPIEEMTVSLDCCPIYEYGVPSDSQKPVRRIFREGGLTVGALYDRTEQLLEEHRFCPEAYSGLLEDDGSVRVGVRFVGKVVLQPDDPVYLEWREDKKRKKEEDRKYQKKGAKLEAFCNARKTAHANGDPIPTLQEFVATHGEDADWASLAWPAVPPQPPFTFNNPFPHPPPPPLPSALPIMPITNPSPVWSTHADWDVPSGSSTQVDAPDTASREAAGIVVDSSSTEGSELTL